MATSRKTNKNKIKKNRENGVQDCEVLAILNTFFVSRGSLLSGASNSVSVFAVQMLFAAGGTQSHDRVTLRTN